jgi:hypothetical protein
VVGPSGGVMPPPRMEVVRRYGRRSRPAGENRERDSEEREHHREREVNGEDRNGPHSPKESTPA